MAKKGKFMLKIGTKAPKFCLPNQDEVEICLRDLSGKWIILYFYPKDNTPGCSTQACDFTKAEPEFEDMDAVILGVSPDSPAKHQKFIQKKKLTITLLADEEKELCNLYGVWQLKKFMGREYMGVARSTFIINPKGEIVAVWEKVKVKEHALMVKEKLAQLQIDFK